jgi:hypothetical protein
MSAPAFAWAMERGAALSLSPSERLVLFCLADKLNATTGKCCPGQETIEYCTGLAPKTIRVAIAGLVKAALVTVDKRTGMVTHYHLQRPGTPVNGAGVDPGNPSRGNPGKSSHTTPVNGAGAPRQNVPTYPGTIFPEPQHILPPTPVKCAPEPLRNQEREPRKEEPPLPPRLGGKRGKPLPEGWQPSVQNLAFGFDLGMSREQIVAEAEAMRDWASHKREVGHDWPRRFNNWLRTAHRQGLRHRPAAKPTLAEEWDLKSFLVPTEADDEHERAPPPGTLLS